MSRSSAGLLAFLNALALFALTSALACKKSQNTLAQSAPVTTAGNVVSGFVTREQGYLDTAAGRKHIISMAARIGLKRVFVDVWSRGCTLYRSEVMKRFGAEEICGESEGDPLAELMKYGDLYKIEVVPWFEWGNIVPVQSAIWRKNKSRGWSGFAETFHNVPSIRINPYKGDFDNFIASLMKEVVTKYGAKEIHICDNFAPHTKSGPATVIKGPVAFTAFVRRVTLPARNAGARFSLSAQRNLNSLQTFSIDWIRWINNGIVASVYPQLYHVKENNSQQFLTEAKAEKSAGAVGVVLYTGPSEKQWTLAGVGRFVKIAQSSGLESAIFDLNTLLADQNVKSNAQVAKISAALGIRMRTELPSGEKSPPEPTMTNTGSQTDLPPVPVLPPPIQPPQQVQPPQQATAPATRPATDVAATIPQDAESSSTATSAAPTTPTDKTRLCEYMKVSGAPEGGAPTYLSPAKNEIIDTAMNGQLVYRHLTQVSSAGDLMMYVTLYSSDGSSRIRWLDAKYLVERRPDQLTCAP